MAFDGSLASRAEGYRSVVHLKARQEGLLDARVGELADCVGALRALGLLENDLACSHVRELLDSQVLPLTHVAIDRHASRETAVFVAIASSVDQLVDGG